MKEGGNASVESPRASPQRIRGRFGSPGLQMNVFSGDNSPPQFRMADSVQHHRQVTRACAGMKHGVSAGDEFEAQSIHTWQSVPGWHRGPML